MKPVIALVSARAAQGLDEDLPPLEAALRAAGAEVHVTAWDDPAVDWSRYPLALLRSTWDYADRLQEFLAWVDRASTMTRVANPPPVIRWNTDKHYLAELARAGVAIVPSEFIEPGERAEKALAEFVVSRGCAELVVKPAVGAGSRDTQRHPSEALQAATAHAERLLRANRSVLVQPYLNRVDEDGETALVYFDGRFSHAIRKGPLLPRGAEPTKGLFAIESITPRIPQADELRAGDQVLDALPFDTPLYARVDLVRDEENAPCLLELELTEPSLFFARGPGSAERFATAILALYGTAGSARAFESGTVTR